MGDRVKNLLIGIFVITGILILVFTILFLKPSVGDGKEILYVRFTNINKIGIGTYVTYAGRPVGEVVAIQEISHLREQPTDTLGRFYVYQLVLKIDSGIKVYDTDKISLQTSGLLGEKSVAITPQKPGKGVIPKLITHQPIYADSIDPIENTFYELSQLADEVEGAVKDLRAWLDRNKDPLSYAVEWFGETMHQASITLKTFNEGDMITHLNQASKSLASVMCQIDAGLCQLHEENSFQNAGVAISHLKEASLSIAHITRSIEEGRGSIGKLFKGDDFYLSLMAVMSKVNTLMNDINHYGLLFSNNKQWQRLRTQRASLINSLDSPQELTEYFNEEVDLINTAMSRLSLIVEKSEAKGTLTSDNFKKEFADLLRQVENLADNLRLYNEQIMDATHS